LTCGEFDEATPETTRYYSNKFPNATMRIFERASHEHHLEKAKEYIEAVRRFLKGVE
jgi:proline iminopeptidase